MVRMKVKDFPMKSYYWPIIATAFLLSACAKGDVSGVDGRSFLEALAGPKVETMSDTLIKSAQESEEAGNYPRAIQFYQQAIDKYPDRTEYKAAIGDAFRKNGEPDRALSVYDEALKQEPALAAAREGKGLALMQKGDTQAAAALLTEVRASGKSSWRTPNALGIMSAAAQQPDQARAYFAEAQKASPGNPSILNNLGLAQALNRDFDAAIATLNQATSLAQGRPALHKQVELNAALVYGASGRLEEAEAIARKYFTGPALNNNLGFYAHLANDDQLSKTYLNMALTQSKSFYKRAWENLEAVQSQPASPGNKAKTITIAAPEPKPAAQEAKPVEESRPMELTPPPAEAPNPVPAPVPEVATPAVETAPPPAPETVAAPTPTPAPAQAVVAPEPPPAASPATPMRQRIRPKEKPAGNGFDAIGNWFGSIVD